jgi:hypothetical protein
MDSTGLESRRQAVRQLVLRLLAPHARQLQPVELIWMSNTTSHEQQLCVHVQNNSEPRLTISFSRSQLDSAVSPHDLEAYRSLQDYIGQNLRPLIG